MKVELYEKAVKCYDEVISLRRDLKEAHNNKGVALMRLNRLDDAERCFSEAIRIDPYDNVAFINKGDVMMELDEYD
jgi:tetratricopeptide (TPR) repeat protein